MVSQNEHEQAAQFWESAPEKSALNQYWYSHATIEALAGAVRSLPAGACAAMVSTPSIYFALSPEERKGHRVLDFDKQWESDPGFTFYDFNAPLDIAEELHHSFDLVVIDPPFITREVWEKYALTARLLLREGVGEDGMPCGRLLCTTVRENRAMMLEILQVEPCAFRPSIPNLVYQYDLYTNYSSPALSVPNPEIDELDAVPDEPLHQGLRVEHEDDKMVIPTHRKGPELAAYPAEEEATNSDAVIPEPVMSAEVQLMTKRRGAAGDLKKALEQLVVVVEATIKGRVKASKAEGEAAQSAQAAFQGSLQELDVALQEATNLAEVVGTGEVREWQLKVEEVAQAARAEMRTKKQLMGFSELVRKQGQGLFALQRTMLQEIKELKRRELEAQPDV